MSTPFYDLASLVVVPSGYKASKVYAQKPLTTDGQLNFSRASTATRVNASGLIETVASNVPPLDYLGSTCPKLQLEPQRSNVLTYSSAFDNAAWSKDEVSVSANASTSPDGTANADSIVENSATGFHFIQQTFTSSAVSTTYSIFAKLGSGTRTLILREGVNTGAFAAFNLSTGVVAAESGGTATVTQYANGYYRCTLTFTAVAGTSSMQIGLSNANSFASYAGNGTSSIIVYGAQAEAGAYPTSLINTTTAAVTRLADACSKTGISSLIGQTEGTVFGEFTFTGIVPEMHMFLSVAGSYGNAVYIENSSSNRISMQVWSGVTQQCFIITGSYTVGQNIKFAAAYKNNDFVFYVNGTQIGTDTSGSVPSGLSQVEVGGYAEAGSPFNYSSSMKQALLFKTRLTNAQLAELTAL